MREMVRHTEPWHVEECWSQTCGDTYYIEGEQNAQRVGNRLLIANALDLALALANLVKHIDASASWPVEGQLARAREVLNRLEEPK